MRGGTISKVAGVFVFMLLVCNILVLPAFAQDGIVPETFDLVMVIDNSNSMSGTPVHPATDEYNLRIATARVLLDVASTDFEASRVRVGVITFGDQAIVQTDGLVYANEIAQARDVVQPARQGNTIIEYAFRQAYELLVEGGSYEGKHVSAVVFMTDGRPYDGFAETPEDYERLFDNAQPWVDRLAEAGTRLYIAAFNPLEEVPVLDQERWQAFAAGTGGEYQLVTDIEEASAFFERVFVDLIFGRELDMILEGQVIEPGETITEEFEVGPFFDRLTIAAIHTHQLANRYIEAHLFGPDGAEVRCGQQNSAAENLLCRGLEPEDTDTVWTLIRPQPGTWRVELRGGEGYIKVWKVHRTFGLVFVRPQRETLLSPGDPLEIEVGLCETTLEAMQSCQEDPDAALIRDLNYDEALLTDLRMTVVVQDPSGRQSRPEIMTYDVERTRFTHFVVQEAQRGAYRLDIALYYGAEIELLGANSTVVYVGYLPAIESIQVYEQEDDGREGISAREPLELRVLLRDQELAVPNTLTMTGSTLAYPDGSKIFIAPTPTGFNNAFATDLGAFTDPGIYGVEVHLAGVAQINETTVFTFGNIGQPQVTGIFTFEVLPIVQPELGNIEVVSQATTAHQVPIQAQVLLSRRADERPQVIAELLSPGGQLVSSVELTTSENPYPSGRLNYVGQFSAPQKPGRYTVRVSLVGGNSQIATVVVRYPLVIRILLGTAGVLLLATIGAVGYWFFAVRDLVPRVVIGTLTIEKKIGDNEYKQEGEVVSLSATPRRTIPLDQYAPDPEVKDVKAQLVGQVKNRREQIEPLLRMKCETEHITVDGIRLKEQVLRDGARILTPNYRLTYRLGTPPPAIFANEIPLIKPPEEGINI